ncbi:T3SS effector HopA1 family protein [Gryllotalpicola ginsengisoli]|uniref:T3SS effector HopA1 family protein n=1 Tax=Gryllotalpicola ginsengisoli TaxID=444608 RepID=UPI0003B67894|nr:T3SS effector HopA1 family protein [Gryllotalpicola ginsengisoli]
MTAVAHASPWSSPRTSSFPDAGPGEARPPRASMRWYPLLRRIAREVGPQPGPDAEELARRLYAAYFHAHGNPQAWPPRTDAGVLRPVPGVDGAFAARLAASAGPRHPQWSRIVGYFTVHGAARATRPPEPTVRCYLNLLPEAAPRVFAAATAALEASALVFAGKLLDNPRNFGRPDAAVFYAGRRDAAALARTMLAMRADAPEAFGAEVPGFTREFAPGVAIADDPGAGVSFGLHRCRLVAEALIAAGDGDPHERLGAIITTMLAAGVDPARPHLGPGLPEFDLDGGEG